MAKSSANTSFMYAKPVKKHGKASKKFSNSKRSKNYKKSYVGQGR